jgi:hypothetical protein
MTVIQMSGQELTRLRIMIDLADGRITVEATAALMGLGRRQVFRLRRAFAADGASALSSRKRFIGRELRPMPQNTDRLVPRAQPLADPGLSPGLTSLPGFPGPETDMRSIERHKEKQPSVVVRSRLAVDRRSRLQHWHDAVAELLDLEAGQHRPQLQCQRGDDFRADRMNYEWLLALSFCDAPRVSQNSLF